MASTMASLDLLDRLVHYDTTSYRSNLELLEYISDYLSSFNISVSLIYGDVANKANLFATIGDGEKPGIILSGHTDVVTVDGQKWSTNPFELTVDKSRAFGRGSCDMKGFLACVLAAVPKFISANLSCPIHLAFSYDEEVGCVGVWHLVSDVRARNLKIRACIIGEPSSMKPVTAHTGKQVYRCSFHGTPMHSSLAPKGVNAIAFAGELIHRINQFEEEIKSNVVKDSRFAVAHPTINIGEITGGKAVNIIAEACTFNVEYRYPSSEHATLFSDALTRLIDDDIRPRMKAINHQSEVTYERVVAYPSFSAPPNSEAVSLVRRITESDKNLAVNFGTEAGIYEETGFSAVVCGPGNIDQAHQPNEYIELSQLDACDSFLEKLIYELSRDGSKG